MKKVLSIIFVILISLSCTNYVPYSLEIKNELEKADVRVRDTQFYLRNPIVFERVLKTSNIEIDKGNLESKSVRIRDRIKFWDRGSIKGLGRYYDNNLYLVFEKDNPLLMTQQNGLFYFHVPNRQIAYDGGYYRVIRGYNWNRVYILNSAS